MGHYVTGLIGQRPSLERFAARHSLHAPVPLTQGLELLPLRDIDLEVILQPPWEAPLSGFNHLGQQFLAEIIASSEHAALVYFETDYFGGLGAQGAVAVRNGQVVFGPVSGEIGPINEALASLGVEVIPPAHDAFESIGLDRHRSAEDWLKPTRPTSPA